MKDKNRFSNMNECYWNQIKPNIGLLSIEDQKKIRKTPIIIFGVGGIGGPLTEQLARVGCEQLIICDNDKFEESNLNRQICTHKNLGQYKVEVISDLVKDINPNSNIQIYYDVNDNNISKLLKNVSIASLTLDDPFASILITRKCRELNIPLIESFGLPYLFSWWYTDKSIDYETFYKLNTKEMSLNEIKNEDDLLKIIKKKIYNKILSFPGLNKTYNRETGALEKTFNKRSYSISIAPIVRMTASFIAFEILYAGILKIKKMNLPPNTVAFDYIRMKLIEF